MRPSVSTLRGFFYVCLSQLFTYIYVNQKIKIMITVSELTDERYEQIDSIVDQTVVDKFIKTTEHIQINLLDKNIEASEIYQYLLTIMLNQC